MPAKKKTSARKRSTIRRAARRVSTAESSLNFTALVDAIRQVHEQSAAFVSRTVNTTLTLRNWVIGACIHHYELTGLDRAKYGEGLLDALADRLTELHVSNCNRRQLYRYLRFWRLYPAIVGTVSPQFPALPAPVQEVGTV